ncbi:MAG: rod shape-determining protein MreC [Flavobacteriales bacterium]|nr:rod shape-determining protein MreC [Flavobacteriales bacterium]
MRRLLQFLKKFRDFLIFFILQLFVLGLFFNSKNYHRATMMNTSSGLVGWFVEKKHNITKHFDLVEANEKLVEENARLRALMPESFYKLQDRIYYVNDTLMHQQYEYLPAEVINSSSNKRDNYFTINKGTDFGIEEGMGVICKEGAVGRVTAVSQHYALVKNLLSENIRLGVKLEKNNEYWIMNWDGRDDRIAQIENVKRDVELEVGDTVVTRGGATMFPTHIPVGVIDEVVSVDGEQTISLNIKLFVNFNAAYHVYVVKNRFKDEQKELEGDLFNAHE